MNISGQCREEILSTDVTAHDIFDRARAEVLAVMEVRQSRVCKKEPVSLFLSNSLARFHQFLINSLDQYSQSSRPFTF